MAEFGYSDLVQWARERLPAWQQDALRRLVEKSVLSPDDVKELSAMALSPYVRSSQAPTPTPPSEDIQLSESEQPCVQLLTVRDIRHVNALAPGPVRFGQQGLTVIYGGNASGKSGLVRILKKTCHSRDPGGEIHPNVFEADPGEPAAATVDFLVDGEERPHYWVDGRSTKDPSLRAVNVFDSRCAQVQVERANRILYTPEILQVFRSLATAIGRVSESLRAQRDTLGSQSHALAALSIDGETAAGRFFASLRADSRIEDLEALCTFGSTEEERLAALNRALADDPSKRAVAEEVKGRAVKRLGEALAGAVTVISEKKCREIEEKLVERDKAREAAEVARKAFAEDAELSGVGSETWRTLWESARTYSETDAYPGEDFPVLKEGAVCVLCQQELLPKAQSRFREFERFVKADVQQKADRTSATLKGMVAEVESFALPRFVRRDLREAGILNSSEGEAARRFLVVAKVRRRQILRTVESRSTRGRPPLPEVPCLDESLRKIQEEASRLRRASEERERQQMQQERSELQARELLARNAAVIRAEIVRLKRIAELDRAIDDCKTHPVTYKRREAAKCLLTDRLRSNFQQNLHLLGFSESPVEVKLGAGDHGEHPVEVKLIARPEVGPEEVLSEGERTCVALAGLLAELQTTRNRASLVLDDPVSSLDHQYRKRVAERLLQEARHRQVILFTHDIVFLYLLRKYQAQMMGVQMTELTLQRGFRGNHGRAEQGPPWIAMSVKERVTQLRGDVVEARGLLNEGKRQEYERRASRVYKRLRKSWERAVEEVLLNHVVIRFGDSVQTRRLSKLTDISDDDIERVTREMSRCSDFEHDEPGAVHADLPDPGVIEDDIRKLENWVKELRQSRGRG